MTETFTYSTQVTYGTQLIFIYLYIGLAWHFYYMYLISTDRFITHNTKSALTLGGFLNGESPKLNNSSAFYTVKRKGLLNNIY